MKKIWLRICTRLLLLYFVGCVDERIDIKSRSRKNNGALVAITSVEDDDSYVTNVNFNENKRIFQPTGEWKVVEADEVIPSGLHVRLNLQTGEKEAKILANEQSNEETSESKKLLMKSAIEDAMGELQNSEDGSDSNLKYWEYDGKQDVVGTKKERFSKAKLKEALKKFETTDQEKESRGGKFRNMKDIKKEFEELNYKVKLDSEILEEFISRYNNLNLTKDEKMNILNNLEYYLHQIDNANLFVDLGGLKLLIRDINSSSEDIQSSSLLVLASAVQSNPHSQAAVVQEGLLEVCLRVVTTTTTSNIRVRGIHALSTTMRNFPFAQKKFSDLGGFESVMDLMKTQSIDERSIIKLITMVTDLKEEQLFAEVDDRLTKVLKKEKVKQYRTIHLVDKLMHSDWCLLLPQCLAFNNVESKEKVLNAMWSWMNHCSSQFQASLSLLRDTEIELGNIEGSDEQKEYYNELRELVRNIVKTVGKKDEL